MNSEFQQRLRAALGSAPQTLTLLSGGDTATAAQIVMPEGQKYFLKYVSESAPFEAEALGLTKLQTQDGIAVPRVMACDRDFLLLEWIDFAPPPKNFQRKLGEQLALTHLACREHHYGFPLNHYIGATPQQNLPIVAQSPGSWAMFWWTYRLEPMLQRIGDPTLSAKGDVLANRLTSLLPDPQGAASLIHGDLWNGNVGADPQGRPIIFDPAAYYGHVEAELAMTQMFGGFSAEFYDAYSATFGLEKDWQERQKLYMLYHILNHALLFGGAYLSQAHDILNAFI